MNYSVSILLVPDGKALAMIIKDVYTLVAKPVHRE